MPFRRKIALLLASGAMLLPAATRAQIIDSPQQAVETTTTVNSYAETLTIPAQRPVKPAPKEIPPKDKEAWVKRLVQYCEGNEDSDNIIHEFAYIAPDLMAEVLKDGWKQFTNDNARAHLMEVIEAETAGQADYEPEDAPVSPDRINPRLLELLQYGATDASNDVRKRTYNTLFEIAGIAFEKPEEFLAWRKQVANKPLPDVVTEGMRHLVTNLGAAKGDQQKALLLQLVTVIFVSDFRVAAGHEVAGATAIKLTATRRKAALDAGLLDTLANILHTKPTGESADYLLLALSHIRPTAAYLAKIEPDVKSIVAAATNEKGVNDNMIGILLAYQSDWATAALNKTIEARYIAPDSQSLIRQLINAHNPRAIPLLIALFDILPDEMKEEAHNELKRLVRAGADAKPTADYWRAWWEKNKASQPENVRNVPLPNAKTGLELWTERITKGSEAYGLNYQVKQGFAQQNPELQYRVLQAVWPKLTSENLRRDLLFTILQPENLGVAGTTTGAANPHFLDVLQLGVEDKGSQVQQQALTTASDFAMQTLDTPEAFLEWRKKVGNKPLIEILSDGCKTFATQFAAADGTTKLDLFDRLSHLQFSDGVEVEKKEGKTVKRLQVSVIESVRRKAMTDAGLLDTMATLLHDPKAPELGRRALVFLAAYRPEEAYLLRVEPDARRIFEARFAEQDPLQDDTLNLLFDFKGAWTMPLLIKFIQRDYITPNVGQITNALLSANDLRALPLLIGLMPTVTHSEYNNLNNSASGLANITFEEKHDAAFWRDWWEKNRAKYPEEVRTLALTGLKGGLAVLEERILNNPQQYGLDYRIQESLMALDGETQYKVLHDVWNRDVSENAKSAMLQAVANAYTNDSQKPDNPRLLDILHLGMMDEAQNVQQTASTLLAGIAMQQFPSPDAYLVWRKQSTGKPLADIVRAGAADFVVRFKKADDATKGAMLEVLEQARFLDSIENQTVNGKPVTKASAKGLTAIRRKTVQDGGLLDAIVPLLSAQDETMSATAVRFLSNFRPDTDYMTRIEEPMKRAYTAFLKKDTTDNYVPLNLMLTYHSAWVGELLTQYVQKTYLQPNSSNTIRELTYCGDKRAVPLVLSLLESVGKSEQQEMLRNLPQLTGTQYDATHNVAWWYDWWEKNKASQPEEVRAIPLLELKKGKDAMVARLAQSKEGWDWQFIQAFDTMDAEAQYAVLKESWKTIGNEQMKSQLFQRVTSENPGYGGDTAPRPINPHLLDMAALAVGDESEMVRTQALNFASGLAMREIKDAKAFEAWRKEAGDKPLPDLVRENTRALVTQLKQADAKVLPKLLERVEGVSWVSWYNGDQENNPENVHIVATGLTGIRRQTATEMNLPDILIGLIKPNNPPEVNQKVLVTLAQFAPGEAYMRRVEEEVKREVQAELAKKSEGDFSLLSLLNNYPAAWATDATLQLAQRAYKNDASEAISALTGRRDRRIMPTLIAMLDDLEEDSWERQMTTQALSRLAQVSLNTRHDAAWWRDWWNKNKASFPEEVRNEKFPDLQLAAKYARTFSIKRSKKEMQIAGDTKRTYWLVTSGVLINRKPVAKPASNPPANDFSDIPSADRPGLIVVLSDTEQDASTQGSYWQDVVGRGFGGKYLVALAVPPHWREKQSPLWLTRKERGDIKEATFTTESFVEQIVKDVESKYPVNAERVFLQGVGAGGQAVYACSLEPQTPFHGFAVQGAPFRSAGLPALTTAKGRRYYLLHSQQDTKTPAFVASVAQDTLKKAGADVKLTLYTPDPNAAPKTLWEAVAEGIKWLESGAVQR